MWENRGAALADVRPAPSRRAVLRAWPRGARIAGPLLFAAGFLWSRSAQADFALRPGDRVVVLGDGNASAQLVDGASGRVNAAPSFFELVENYTLLSFPERQMRFVNLFRDTATTAELGELVDRAIGIERASVLIVVSGMNDLVPGPNSSVPTAAEFSQRSAAYVAALTQIVDRAIGLGVRVFVCSYPVTSTDASTVYGNPALHDLLEQLGDAGIAAAEAHHATGIRLTDLTQAIAERARQQGLDLSIDPAPFGGDGFHLNELGHVAVAYCLLKGLGAPSTISSAAISVVGGTPLVSASGATISGASWDASARTLRFTRFDHGLPFAIPINGDAFPAIVGLDQDINVYQIQVSGLPTSPTNCYRVTADGRWVARLTSESLAHGLNVANSRPPAINNPRPGGPWDAQALQLAAITRGRSLSAELLLDYYSWLPGRDPGLSATPANQSLDKDVRKLQRSLVRLQREVARARPYDFVVEPCPS